MMRVYKKKLTKEDRDALGLVIAIIVGLAMGYFVSHTLLCKVTVEGISMQPTYDTGDNLLVSRVKTPKRGDTLIFHHGKDNLIKRVIGIPGDTIMFKDSNVYLNGSKIEENYIKEDSFGVGYLKEGAEYKVKRGEYFVMGDNRNHSLDSRYFGVVKEEDVIGVEIWRCEGFASLLWM